MAGSRRRRGLVAALLSSVAAVALPFAVGAATLVIATEAHAQDYSNSTLTGAVVGKDGAPVAGATVTVKSKAQGFERSATTNANGEWRVPQLPQGGYDVTVAKSGFKKTETKDVRVQVGAANAYRIEVEAAAGADDIVVTATAVKRQDFSKTSTGISIDVTEASKQLPIARNINAIALLAPSVVQGDSAFAIGSAQGQAPVSLSGASGGENAFYVNGLNITNFINGIGGATVPFDFYQNVEVKTGGYQAEFGRATGGVINATTKSGSNDFMLALHGSYEPNDLREDAPNSATRQYSLYDDETKSLTVEVGGPIIKDHLFFYGLGTWQDREFVTATSTGTLRRSRNGDPFYGFKLDGFITDTQHLEFTYFDTSAKQKTNVFRFDPATNVIGANQSSETLLQGGESYVGRYTGAFTDWLTVSAAYGRSEVDQANFTNLTTTPRVQDQRLSSTGPDLSPQRTAAGTFPFLAEREFYRGDVDLYFSLLGDHHVKFGYDRENTTLTENSVRNGGANYIVRRAGPTGNIGLGLAPGQEYLERRVFVSGGGFEGKNEAIYIQDSWDPTSRLNLSLGVRQDKFVVANPLGQAFVNFDGEIGARVGASYDVFGDKRAKLYGFYGRYYLPVASNTSFRAAAPATDISEFFLPPGGGATFANGFQASNGLPVGGFGPQVVNQSQTLACPAGTGSVATAGTLACVIRNNGRAPSVDSIIATNLKSTYEDEFLIGYQQEINSNWSAGVSLTYRNLGRVSEDALVDQGIIAYCKRKGLDVAACTDSYPGASQYYILNPGFDAAVVLPTALPNGDTRITLSASDLGLPKVKREYLGLTFQFERAFDGKWGLQGSYTLSKSEGNFEGALKSDIGQTDAGITEDFDFLSFIPGQYGLLPNHHAHQLKLFGSYAFTDALLAGANLSVTSPRKYGCIGGAPPEYANGDGATANDSYGVPANARFCNGVVVDRGSAFEADWIYRVDLSFRYTVPKKLMKVDGLTLRADVFNVFNAQGAQEAYENGETGTPGNPDPKYGQAVAYQTPRYVRIGFDWQF